jgi:tetratricopeptide (TPR) repeat protein
MKFARFASSILSSLACCSLVVLGFVDGAAADTIRKIARAPNVLGTVRGVSATEVNVEVQGAAQKIPTNEIDAIVFDNEPPEMQIIRGQLKSGNDQSAITTLGRIKPETVTRKEVKQDYEFYAALAQSRLALRGVGKVDVAGTAMFKFVNSPDGKSSYHYYQAQETMGELLVALKNFDEALKCFAELENSPFDDLKMRAGVARGRALLVQGKYPEAQKAFEAVLALKYDPATQKGTPAETQRFAATLGRTQCISASGNYDEAIKELEEKVIAGLAAEETELQALAYVTLGNCYNAKPDGKKAALLAFLHVDVLYAAVPAAHAEALWNLSNIWTELGKNERGQECLNRLNRQYPGSPWLTKKKTG